VSKSAGSAPAPPKLKQVNIPQAESQATAADIHGYNLSDQDYAKRFPDLVSGRQYNVNNAVSNLQGQTDPHIASAIQGAGLGTPNLGSNEFQQARSLGQPILAKEKRDRNYFQSVLSDNPQRAFGLSGGDVASLAQANIGAQNQFNQNIYGTRIQGYNQNILQNAQLNSALIGSFGSLASTGIKYVAQPSSSSFLGYGQYAPSFPAAAYIPGGLDSSAGG
jgi:hypothetical protein